MIPFDPGVGEFRIYLRRFPRPGIRLELGWGERDPPSAGSPVARGSIASGGWADRFGSNPGKRAPSPARSSNRQCGRARATSFLRVGVRWGFPAWLKQPGELRSRSQGPSTLKFSKEMRLVGSSCRRSGCWAQKPPPRQNSKNPRIILPGVHYVV